MRGICFLGTDLATDRSLHHPRRKPCEPCRLRELPALRQECHAGGATGRSAGGRAANRAAITDADDPAARSTGARAISCTDAPAASGAGIFAAGRPNSPAAAAPDCPTAAAPDCSTGSASNGCAGSGSNRQYRDRQPHAKRHRCGEDGRMRLERRGLQRAAQRSDDCARGQPVLSGSGRMLGCRRGRHQCGRSAPAFDGRGGRHGSVRHQLTSILVAISNRKSGNPLLLKWLHGYPKTTKGARMGAFV